MTGCAVIAPDRAVVVAEGTARSQKRYAKVMLERLWYKKEDEDAEGCGLPSLVLGQPVLCSF